MSVIPNTIAEQVAFHNAHEAIFAANAAALDLTAGQTAEYTTLAGQCDVAVSAVVGAAIAYRAAVQTQNTALGETRAFASELIKSIRVHAAQTNDPDLYAIAGIPAPKTPSPIAPVTPSNVRFELNGDGSLRVMWDGVLSAGGAFEIWRRTTDASGAVGPAELVGVEGVKFFVDSSIPAGTQSASYSIKAVKGATKTPGSEWTVASFTVGHEGDGESSTIALAA